MGTKPRIKPERLGEKLRQIRLALGLSQAEIARYLGIDELIAFKQISTYELGKREPPLVILLRYARAANISTDVLIDDELELPDRLPSKSKPTRR
ncbi:MAG TPA: helix-turn-helix transcriptional regulator [Pyrinomonadaceae bacterium]|jgi:transcriptional regulator with XRE-family HTH domain